MKKMIKKVIAPVLVITVLFAVLRTFCIQDGKCNYFLLLLLMDRKHRSSGNDWTGNHLS